MMINRTHPHSFCYLLKLIFFHSTGLESTLILTSIATSNSKSSQLTSSRAFAAKKAKSSVETGRGCWSSIDDATHDVISDERNRRRLLDEDERETGGGVAVAIC
uniref:Uncharacterized protein n=1 Tax=Lactuca sativa TaxID=4236 RepID=A0A9R1X5L2_LACSA|nr:hypothetical protein LSAT_V11C600316600 [Lactuca sativa]